MRAPSINMVRFAGNVAAEPRGKAFEDGNGVLHLFVINNELVQSRKGPFENSTPVAIDVWGKAADLKAAGIKKGDAVQVDGKLALDAWEKDGQKRRELKIRAQLEYVTKLGGDATAEAVDADASGEAGEELEF